MATLIRLKKRGYRKRRFDSSLTSRVTDLSGLPALPTVSARALGRGFFRLAPGAAACRTALESGSFLASVRFVSFSGLLPRKGLGD